MEEDNETQNNTPQEQNNEVSQNSDQNKTLERSPLANWLLLLLFILAVILLLIIAYLLGLNQNSNDTTQLQTEIDRLQTDLETSRSEDEGTEDEETQEESEEPTTYVEISIDVPGLEATANMPSDWELTPSLITGTSEGIGVYEIDAPPSLTIDGDEQLSSVSDPYMERFSFTIIGGLEIILNTVPNQITNPLNPALPEITELVPGELYRIQTADSKMYVNSLTNCLGVSSPCYSDDFAYLADDSIALGINLYGNALDLAEVDAFVIDLLGY